MDAPGLPEILAPGSSSAGSWERRDRWVSNPQQQLHLKWRIGIEAVLVRKRHVELLNHGSPNWSKAFLTSDATAEVDRAASALLARALRARGRAREVTLLNETVHWGMKATSGQSHMLLRTRTRHEYGVVVRGRERGRERERERERERRAEGRDVRPETRFSHCEWFWGL